MIFATMDHDNVVPDGEADPGRTGNRVDNGEDVEFEGFQFKFEFKFVAPNTLTRCDLANTHAYCQLD